MSGAVTLNANVRAMKPSLVSIAARGIAPPALLTRMSSRPNSSTVRVHEVLARGRVGDVGRHDERAPAERADVTGHLFEVGLGASRQRDVGAGLGQPDRDPAADAEPGAGDDRDAAVDREPVEDHRARAGRGADSSDGAARRRAAGRGR